MKPSRSIMVVNGLPAIAAGASLRLAMLRAVPQVSGDALLYGNLAKNLLRGSYAITDGSGVAHPTLIRLPGYPLFLAACFRLFGADNYTAVSYLQIAMDLAACILLAAFVRRIANHRAALWTLWLAALCPFTASYAIAPLTEAPTLFAISAALWALARFHARPGWSSALLFTCAVASAALLRPDGALVALALAPALFASALSQSGKAQHRANRRGAVLDLKPKLRMGAVCTALALLPFALWAARNWRVFHVIEPLAPRYANDPGEPANPGWQRWVKTWCLDFVSTYEIYWNVPGAPLDLSELPARAFDSPSQYAETAAVASAYNENGQDLSPDLDRQFARLAAQRISSHPLRYYLALPLGRLADMWLRPRVENLNIDLDWWAYWRHHAETRFSWAYALLNALYLSLALAGLCLRPRFWQGFALYFLLRSALLMTIEAPEARYTLECFPMIFALAGVAMERAQAALARPSQGAFDDPRAQRKTRQA